MKNLTAEISAVFYLERGANVMAKGHENLIIATYFGRFVVTLHSKLILDAGNKGNDAVQAVVEGQDS